MESFFRLALFSNIFAGSLPRSLTSFSFSLFAPTRGKMRRAMVLPRCTRRNGFHIEFDMYDSAPLRIMVADSPYLGEGMQVVPTSEWSDEVPFPEMLLIIQVNHMEMPGTITFRCTESVPGEGVSNKKLLSAPHGSAQDGLLPCVMGSFDFRSALETHVAIDGCLDRAGLSLTAKVGRRLRSAVVAWHGRECFQNVGFAAASARLVTLRNVIIL